MIPILPCPFGNIDILSRVIQRLTEMGFHDEILYLTRHKPKFISEHRAVKGCRELTDAGTLIATWFFQSLICSFLAWAKMKPSLVRLLNKTHKLYCSQFGASPRLGHSESTVAIIGVWRLHHLPFVTVPNEPEWMRLCWRAEAAERSHLMFVYFYSVEIGLIP